MGHIHRDNGSVVIGTQGRWLITDPGYQQYLKTAERSFTIGHTAHNAPVIDGQAQIRPLAARDIQVVPDGPECWRADIDLTSCYPEELKLRSAGRTVWLLGREVVVVADQIIPPQRSVRYSWHGHPEAAWWAEGGRAGLYLSGVQLLIASPQLTLTGQNIDRLPGSRGHMTLTAEIVAGDSVVWWVFATDRSLEIGGEPQGKRITVAGRKFDAG